MSEEPLVLVKKSFINMRMLLIIGAIVIVFFLFIYPTLKKRENFGMNDITAMLGMKQNFTNQITEKFGLGDLQNMLGMAQPATPKTTESTVQHFTPAFETFANVVEPMEDPNTASLGVVEDNTNVMPTEAPSAPIELPEYVKKLLTNTEHMSNNTLDHMENMADVMKGDKIDAFGTLKSVNNNAINNYRLEDMMCSKSCCSNQWGIQGEKDPRILPNDVGTKYFPTNYTCSGDNATDRGNGCVCMNKDTFSFLGNRGGNNSE
jgi:hypothetical protein